MFRRFSTGLVAVLVCVAVQSVAADPVNYTWKGGTSFSWNELLNWNPSDQGVPGSSGAGDTIKFDSTAAGTITIGDGNYDITGISFIDAVTPGTFGNYTLNSVNASGAAIRYLTTITQGGGTNAINTDILLSDSTNLKVHANGGTLTLGNLLQNAVDTNRKLVIDWTSGATAGAVVLTMLDPPAGKFAFSGGVALADGATLQISDDRNLGAAGSPLSIDTASTLRIETTAGAFASSLRAMNLGAGGAVINVTTAGDSHTATWAGGITGAAGLTKTGAGTLILSGANTFTGGVKIKSGTAVANVSNVTTVSGAFGPSGSAITLGDSAGGSANLLANSFTVSNAINLGTLAVGTLTIGNNGTTTAAVFSGPISLNSNNLTVSTTGTTGSTTISGGITGTGNLLLDNAGSAASTITLGTAAINNTGTITVQGAGTGATTISGAVGTGVTKLTENSAASALNVTGAISSRSANLTLDGNGNALTTLSGGLTFSGAGGLVIGKSGTLGTTISGGAITLGGSGGITISGGASAVSLGAATVSAAQSWTNNSANTFTVNGLVGAAANTLTLTGSGDGLTTLTGGLTFSGAGGLVIGKSGTLGTTISGGTITLGGTGGITINSGASAVSLGANTVSAAQSWTNNSANTFTVNGLVGAAANTLTLAGSGDGLTTLTGGLTFSTTGGLVIGKSGTLGTTISGGAITLGGTGGITINSGASAVSLGAATIGANQNWTNNSSTLLTFSSTLTNVGNTTPYTITLNGSGAGGTTFSGAISNGGTTGTIGLIVNTTGGTTTLSGANTYTGGTTVNGGTLSVTGSLYGTAPYSALAVGGGTFSYAPAAGGGTGNAQNMGAVTVNAGASTINASSGNTLALGLITRGARGTVNFNSTTSGSVTGSVSALSNSIIGPWATYGSGTDLGYAFFGGTAISGTLQTFTGTANDTAISTPASITSTAGTVNYDLSGNTSATAGASASINTLRYSGSGLTITTSTALTLNGLMQAGSGLLTIQSGNVTIGANNELVITGNTQGITISSVIQNNTVGGSSLTYSGGGTLTLSGVNTFTGELLLNAGTIKANTSTGALGAGILALGGGTLDFNHSAALNFARNTTVFGNTTIITEKDTAGAGVTYTLGTLTIGGNTLNVGGGNVNSGTAGLTFGATTLNGNATFNITKPSPGGGSTTLLTVGAITGNANSLTLQGTGDFAQAGVWSGAGSSLVLDTTYAGTATLNQANTFTGGININTTATPGGIVKLITAAHASNPVVTFGASSTGKLQVQVATTLSGLNTNATTVGTPIVENGSGTAYTLTVSNPVANTFAGVLQNGGGAGTLALTKSGYGMLTLQGNNTYTGITTITGVLRAEGASALGANTSATAVTLGPGVAGQASPVTELQLAGDTAQNFGRNVTMAAGDYSISRITSDILTNGAGVTHTLGNFVQAANGQVMIVAGGPHVTSGTAGVVFGNFSISSTGARLVVNNPVNGGTTKVTITGTIGGLAVAGNGSVDITGASGSAGFSVYGGTVNLTGTSGQNTGTATLYPNGTLTLDDTTNNLDNRIGLISPYGGTLNFTHSGVAGTNYLETIGSAGDFTGQSGQFTINASQAAVGQTSKILFGNAGNIGFKRAAGSTMLFSGPGMGVDARNGVFGSYATYTVGTVLPWVLINNTTTGTYNFATFQTGTTTPFGTYSGSYGTGNETTWTSNTVHARPTATQTLTTGRTLASLTLDSGIGLAGPAADRTLTLGATVAGPSYVLATIVQTGGSDSLIAKNGTYGNIFSMAASTELIVNTIGNLTVEQGTNAPFTWATNTGLLTKTGPGTLNLGSSTNLGFSINNLNGAFTINQGTVRVNSSGSTNALGGGSLVINQGRLEIADNNALNLARNTTINGDTTIVSDVTTSGNAGVTHTLGTLTMNNLATLSIRKGDNATGTTAGITFGNTTLSTNLATVDVGTASTVTLGAIQTTTNPYNFTKQGAGNLVLSGASTRATGIMTLNAGTMQLTNVAGAGTAAVTLALNGGTLDLAPTTDATVNAYPTIIAGDVAINAGRGTAAGTITHTLGTLQVLGDRTITVSPGALNGSGNAYGLTFGAVTLNGNPTFTINGNGAGVGTLTLNSGFNLGGVNQTITINGATSAAVIGGAFSGTVGSTLELAGTTPTITVNALTGVYPFNLKLSGSGTYTLGVASTYTGNTILNNSAATVIATNAGGFGTSGRVIFNTSGTGFELRNNTGTSFTTGLDSTTNGGTITVNTAGTAGAIIHTLSGGNFLGTKTITVQPGSGVAGPNNTYGLTLTGANVLTGDPTFTIKGNGTGVGTLSLITGGFDVQGTTRKLTFNDDGSTPGKSAAVVGGALAGAPGTLELAGTTPNVTVNALTGTYPWNLKLSGNGSGVGTYTLAGASTYTGNTILNNQNGTVIATAAAGFGTTSGRTIVNQSGITIDLRGASLAYTTGLDTTANSVTVQVEPASGSTGVTPTVTGYNSFANQLTMSPGAGSLTGAYGLTFVTGTSTLVGNTIFQINNNTTSGTGTLTVAALNGVGNSLTLKGAGNFAQTGVWSGSGSSLVLDSTYSGTATLSQANTFTGGVTIKSGTASGTTNAAAFGNGGTITIGDSTGNANATVNGAFAGPFTNPITVAAGSSGNTLKITGTTVGPTFSGTIALNNDLTVDHNTATFTTTLQTGAITSGAAAVTLTRGQGPGAVTISSNVVIGTGGLTVVDSTVTNTFNLTGNVTTTTTGNLTLKENGADAFPVAFATINNSGSITNSGSGNGATTVSGNIGTNVTSVVQNSSTSSLTLSGTNTFTNDGSTTFGLIIKKGMATGSTAASAFGAGRITLGDSTGNADATLGGGYTGTFTNPITVAGGSTGNTLKIMANGGGSIFSGAVTLNHDLTLASGANSLTLSGGITGTGNLTIASGAYAVTLSTNPVNNTGTITNNGAGVATTTISGGVGANVTAIEQNSTTSALTISTTALTVNGVGGTGTTLTNTAGTQLLTVSGGVGGTGNLILNNNSATAAGITLSTTSVNNTGTITNSGSGSGDTTISIAIGSSVTDVIQNGNSPLILSAASSYTGATTVTSGTFQLGAANVIPDGAGKGNVSVAGTLDLHSFSDTINGLSGAGTVDNKIAGTPTLTVGANDQTSSFSGTIKNTLGTLAVTKTGTGTLTLSGDNTYSGSTIVSAGKLILSGNNVGATGTTTISGGVLQYNSAASIDGTARNVTVTAPGVVTFGSSFGTIQSTLTGRIVNTSTGMIALPASSSEDLDLSAAGANLTAAYLGTLDTGGLVEYSGALTPNATAGYRLGGGGGTLTVSSTLSGSTALTANGSGGPTSSASLLILNGNLSAYTGAVTVSSGTLQIGPSATLPTASFGLLTPTAGTFDTNNHSFTIKGITTGTGTVAGNFSGADGTLTIDTGAGSQSSAVVIADGASATKKLNLVKTGANTQTLTGTSTYTGSTTVNGGTLALTGAGSSGKLSGTNGISVYGTGVLQNGDTTVANNTAARINSGSPVAVTLGDTTLGGGTYTLGLTSAGGGFTQTHTTLTINPGQSTINSTGAGTTAGNLVFSGGASGYLRTAGGGFNYTSASFFTPSFTTAPTGGGVSAGANPILIGATLDQGDFIAAGSGTWLAPSYVTDLYNSADNNVNVTTNASVPAGSTVNSIRGNIPDNKTITLNGLLTVNSGMIINKASKNSTLTITGGSLTSGNGQDLFVNTVYPGGGYHYDIAIASQITGGLALTARSVAATAITLSNPLNSISDIYVNGGANGSGTLYSTANGALGQTADGGTIRMLGGNLALTTAAQSYAKDVVFGQAGTITGSDKLQTFTGNFTATQTNVAGANNVTIAGNATTTTTSNLAGGGLVYLNPDTSSGKSVNITGNLTVSSGVFALKAGQALPSGNLILSGGALVFDGRSPGSNDVIRYADLPAGKLTFTSGGFAGRGATVTLNDPTNLSFDRNFFLGSIAKDSGGVNYFANAGVDIAQNTTLGAVNRVISIAANGPGITGATGSGVTQRISGNLGGTGSVRFAGGTIDNGRYGEIVLSGTNNWTGGSQSGAGPQGGSVDAGNGGLTFDATIADGMNGTGTLVRFDGPSSLPSGNGGGNALIGGMRYNGNPVYGILFTANASAYSLNTGYRLLFGSGGVLGSQGGAATLQNSTVMMGTSGFTQTAATTDSQTLLVRDGTFTLGSASNPVTFIATYATGGTYNTTNMFSATAALVTGTRTLQKRNIGTLVLGNVQYQNGYDLSDSSGTMPFTFGGGTAGVFEGAIRETGTAGTNSLVSNKLTMQGGVLEFGATPRSITLGTAAGNVDMSGTGGGGFSAYGDTRNINIGGALGQMAYGATSFVGTTKPLIFGSTTADNTAVFQNPLAGFNGGAQASSAVRSLATVRGTGAAPEGEISGLLSNGKASGVATLGFSLIGLNKPDGTTALLAGSLLLSNGNNSYDGPTSVLAGNLLLGANATSGAGNTVLGSASSAVLVGDSTGARDTGLLTNGAFTIGRNVTVQSGSSGTATLGGNADAASEFSGTITLNKNLQLSQVANTGSNKLTVSGLIDDSSGSFGLTKTGAGVVALTRAAGNTYDGGTQVNGGTLLVNNTSGSGTGSGTVNVNNGGTLGGTGTIIGPVNINDGGTLAPTATTMGLTGNLAFNTGSGMKVVTTAGAGADSTRVNVTGDVTDGATAHTVALVGPVNAGTTYNVLTWTGTGTISAANWTANIVNAVADPTINWTGNLTSAWGTPGNWDSYDITGATVSVAGKALQVAFTTAAMTPLPGSKVVIDLAGATVNGPTTGDTTIASLNVGNTLASSLTVSGGNLTVNGAVTVGNYGTLNVGAATFTAPSIASTGTVNFNSASMLPLATVSGGTFTQTLGTVTSAAVNTGTYDYQGGTLNGVTFGGGLLKASADLAAVPVSVSTQPINVEVADTKTATFGDITGTQQLNKSGLGTLALVGTGTVNTPAVSGGKLASKAASISGDVTLSNGATMSFTDTTAAAWNNVVQSPSSTGNFEMNGAGGTLTLGAVQTYSGSTAVTQGTLKLAASDRLPGTTALTVASLGTLDLNGANQTVKSLADGGGGGGTVTNSSTTSAVTLTIDGAIDTAFSGVLQDNPTKALSLVKAGAGTQTLTGLVSTYSGTTAVNAGTLAFNSIRNVGALTGSSLGQPTTEANGTITLGVGSTTANLRFIGTSNSITDRIVKLDADGSGGVHCAIDASGSGTLTFNRAAGTVRGQGNALTLTGSGTGKFDGPLSAASGGDDIWSVTKDGSGTWTFGTANTYGNGTTVKAGTLVVTNTTDSATGTGVVTLNGGTLASAATGRVGGAVQAGTGTHTIAPGGTGQIGSLSLGSTLRLNGSSYLNFDVSGTSHDSLSITSTLTVDSGTPAIQLTGTPSGTLPLTLATYASSGVPTFSTPTVSGWTWDITSTYIALNPSSPAYTNPTYTLGILPATTQVHAGGTVGLTTTITNTGTDKADSFHFTALGATPSGGTVNPPTSGASGGPVAKDGDFASTTGMSFTSDTAGQYTLTAAVDPPTGEHSTTPALSGPAGQATVTVYTGNTAWTGGSGPWSGVGSLWDENVGGVHVNTAPGLSSFTTTDKATLSGAAGGTVSLNGEAPSLAGITFDNLTHSFEIAKGSPSNGKLVLRKAAAASDIPVTAANGKHTISVPVEFHDNLVLSATNAADQLTLSDTLTGDSVAGRSVTKTGAGTVTLSGTGSDWSTTNVDAGTLEIASAGALPAGSTLHITAGTVALTGDLGQAIELSDLVLEGFGDSPPLGGAAGFAGAPPVVLTSGGGAAGFAGAGLTANVPEPGTLALLAAGGLLAAGAWVRRRKK